MAPLTVDPTGVSGAGVAVAAVGDGLLTAMTTLTGTANANTGQDAAGVMFGRQYVNTARDLLKAVTAGVNACRNTGYGIAVTATNYSRAEASSDISSRSQPLPSPPCPSPATAPGPPSATGGGVAEPMLWAVVEFLVGDLWPNGDAAAMRTAAASWRTFASTLYGVSGDMSAPYNMIGAQQIDEAELIKKPIRDIGSTLSSVAGTCQEFATALEQFAADVAKTQQAIRDLLDKLGSIGGIVGTFFEFVKGHGEDELAQIADDIKTVLGQLKTEADAKSAGFEAVKRNVDNWALSLEGFADREFVDFFGEDVGRFLATTFNMAVDAEEGGFRWLVSTGEGLSAMNPLRFAYDPQGALQTWKGISEFAALTDPTLAASMIASDPGGVTDILKGLARTDEWSAQRPMLGLSQNLLDVASLAIPGVGEAGAGVDAASAAGRMARVGEVADEAAGVARNAGRVGETARATTALGDVSKQTAGISGRLDDIARRPVSLEPPVGGRPVTPTRPPEPMPPPVVRQAPEPPQLAADSPTAAMPNPVVLHQPVPEVPGGGRPLDPHSALDGQHVGPPDWQHGDHPNGPPTHLPNHEVQADARQPAAATEPQHQSVTNEPVNVATGEYLLPAVDVDIAGVLPLRLTRQHRSQFRQGLWFGPSWATTFDSRAVITDSGVTTIDADGTMLDFDPPSAGLPSVARHGQRWVLHAESSGGYRLEDPRGARSVHFTPLPQLAGSDLAAGVLAVTTCTDRNGNRLSFIYNDIGVPVRVEQSGGRAVDVHCGRGRIRGYSVGGVAIRHFDYSDGDLSSVTNGVGAVTTFAYDEAHRMVSWTDSVGAHYTNTYDPSGRVVSQTGPGGVWAGTFDYRADGDARATVFADALGRETVYRFDADLRPIAVTDPAGRSTSSTFAATPDPVTVTDAAGATTTYRYDPDGQLTQLTDPLGHELALTYSGGRPTQLLGADGSLTRYEYDERGNLVAVHDPAGGIRRWEYDESGAVSGHVDAAGRRTEIACSPAGLPLRLVDAVGNETRLGYDDFGRLVAVVDPDGATTTMTYDVEGRVTSRTAADGSRESWRYDGEGNCVAFSNATGATTGWEYGYYDLVTARIDADGGRTSYGYNVARQLVSVTNPAGLVWQYTYRPDGLLGSEIDFNGATTTYDYDAAGRLAARTNAVGQAVRYTYDLAGNLISETSSADSVLPSEQVSYEYDAAGSRTAATNSAGRLDLTRDAAGRVVVEAWNGRAVTSAFNNAGDLVEIRTPSGLPTRLSYDSRGVVETLAVGGWAPSSFDDGARTCTVSADALGRATTYRYGNAEVQSTWDVMGRLAARSVSVDHKGVLASAGYHYRANGELTDVRRGGGGAALGTVARYDTDVVGRLTGQTLADGSRREFRFDRSENLAVGSQRWEYRGVLLVDDGRSRYSYDRAGRLTTVSSRRLGRKPDVWQYSWDAWDRLRALVTPDGTTFRYAYDPLGRRVAKESSGGSRVEFSWSGTRMVEQVASGQDHAVTSWAYLPGELSPQIQVSQNRVSQDEVDREFFALVTDQVGAPVAVLDPGTGSMAGQSSVSAWGLAEWTGVSTPWRFPGQYHDEESGLHYNFHRYYHPGAGRYISPDPLGLAPAPNPYSYPTNPTGWVDPLGLNPCQGGPGCGDISADTRKFSNYVLSPEGASGKFRVFESFGYTNTPGDVSNLVTSYTSQARQRILEGAFTVKMTDEYGTRIAIPIVLQGIGRATGKSAEIVTGWIMRTDGTITLTTPFSGFVR